MFCRRTEKNLRYLKQSHTDLAFFCLLVQFAVYPMGGIELQNGCNQQDDDPIVVDILQVYQIIDGQEGKMVGQHEQGGQQKKH